jgi:hypothetical protein
MVKLRFYQAQKTRRIRFIGKEKEKNADIQGFGKGFSFQKKFSLLGKSSAFATFTRQNEKQAVLCQTTYIQHDFSTPPASLW